jgi:hypothetical protein
MAMKMDDMLKSFLSLKLKAVLGGRRCGMSTTDGPN